MMPMPPKYEKESNRVVFGLLFAIILIFAMCIWAGLR